MRKKLYKWLSLALCLALLGGLLTACSPSGQESAQSTPGASAAPSAEPSAAPVSEGSGTAQGYGGAVTVTLKVQDGKVVEAAAVGGDETPEIGGKALESMAADMAAKGTVEVDAVSGATGTSTAVLTAARAAYAQATGTAAATGMKPGTYTAEAVGFALSDTIKVSVTVDEEKITAIDVDMDNTETGPILQSVVDLMVPRMIEYNSVAIDAVTGATGSSAGVRAAVTDCLTQALTAGGADASGLSAFQSRPEQKTGPAEKLETKILVVGMGGAGTSAAIRAAEVMYGSDPASVSVLAIDKAGKYGGTAACTQEMMAINPAKFQEEHNNGENYVDVDVMHKAWLAHTEGGQKDYFVDLMFEHSGEMLDWLVYDHNYDMSDAMRGFTDADTYLCKFQYMPNNTAGNKSVIGTYFDGMYKDYTAKGGKYMLETEAYELIYDETSNTVLGVKARNMVDGAEYEIYADAVILASGGFGANGEMETEYLSNEYYPLKGDWQLFGMQQNDGKMVQAALDIGAGTYNIGMSPMVHMANTPTVLTGFEKHYPEGEIAFFTNRQAVWSASDLPMAFVTAPDMLLVGADGKRFTNEADMFVWWKAGPKYYSVISQDLLNKIETEGLDNTASGAGTVYVGMQTAIPAKTPVPETMDVIQAGMDAGWIYKADSIEDLAAQIGVDAAALKATVDGYNAACETGVDKDFGKDAAFLTSPVSGEGPFYAVVGQSYPFSTCGALDIDENFNVLQSDHATPINGLYAIGNDSMGVLFSEKRDYVTFGGAAQGWAYTSGYFAGRYAAEQVASK